MATGILPSSRIFFLFFLKQNAVLALEYFFFPLILQYVDNLKSALKVLTYRSEYRHRVYPKVMRDLCVLIPRMWH